MANPYKILTCEDDEIKAVLIPDSAKAYEHISRLPASLLAYQILGEDTSLEIVSRPRDNNGTSSQAISLRCTDAVIALRHVKGPDISYSLGSGGGCDIVLEASKIGHKAMEIFLFSDEPSVSIQCFNDKVLVDGEPLGDEKREVLEQLQIRMYDFKFRLVPVKTLMEDWRNSWSPVIFDRDSTSSPTPAVEQEAVKSKPRSLTHFRLGKPLGGGWTDWVTVYEYPGSKLGQKLAVKVMAYRSKDRSAAGRRKYLPKEAELAPRVEDHAFLLKILEVFEYPEGFAMIMPRLELGSLALRIRNYGNFHRDDVKTIVHQILNALESLHDQAIIHRDIKLENILIMCLNPIWIKVTDYGFSIMATEAESNIGTHPYIAPEIGTVEADGSGWVKYGGEVDIYALGLSMLRLLQFKPRGGRDSPRSREEWYEKFIAPVDEELRYQVSDDYRNALNTALAMAAYDAECRPDVVSCYALPWFIGLQQHLVTPSKPEAGL